MRKVSEFHLPPMPKACVCCGTPYDLSRQPFRFGSNAPVDLFVCQACWKHHTTARFILWIAAVVAAVSAIGGIALAVAAYDVAPLLVGCGLAALVLSGAIYNARMRRPKRLSKRSGIVVDVPGQGPVTIR